MIPHTLNAAGLARALESRSAWAMLLAGLTGALLLMLAVRSVISHPPTYDELLHVLAARGVVETGEPVILGGVYGRAELFTRLVAWVFEWRGESLWAARLPALVCGMALVVLTGCWVTRRAGLLAGTVASVLLAVTVTSVALAVFARFYTLHALVLMVLFVAIYEAIAHGQSRPIRALWGMLALAAVPIAWHLQETTVIAVGAALLGVVLLVVLDHWVPIAAELKRHPRRYLLAAIGLVIVGLMLARYLGIFEKAGVVPFWAAPRSGDVGFYNQGLGLAWPLVWALFPLAAIAAIAEFRRFGLYCVVVALAAIAVHSVLAAKAMRYAYYAMPLLCAVVGCGVAVGARLLSARIGRLPRFSRPGWGMLIAISLLAMIALNSQEVRLAARLIAGKASWTDLSMFASESDWRAAMPALQAHLGSDSTIVVSSAVKGVYHLGSYDYELNASTVPESESGEEFGRDRRTGRLAISTRESLTRVLREADSALVIIDRDKLASVAGVSSDVVAFIESTCVALEVPVESRVLAWTCRRS